MFRLYMSNMASAASRGMAIAALMFGLFMVAMGALIVAFPKVFALIAAAVFFAIALAAILFSIKMFTAARRARKFIRPNDIIDIDPM